uniref:Uncharacterized protein n=1 Tax=Anopheles coluzzii TaxID=1518534 RepID=A0A8W7Q1J2_ANOCL
MACRWQKGTDIWHSARHPNVARGGKLAGRGLVACCTLVFARVATGVDGIDVPVELVQIDVGRINVRERSLVPALGRLLLLVLLLSAGILVAALIETLLSLLVVATALHVDTGVQGLLLAEPVFADVAIGSLRS